jgi:ribosome biogenesis protein ENP2
VAKYGADGFGSMPEVSAMRFASDGLTYAVGTSTGQVLLYDLRSTAPMLIKDHQYEFPIKNISFHPATSNVMTADTKIIKIWNKDSVCFNQDCTRLMEPGPIVYVD